MRPFALARILVAVLLLTFVSQAAFAQNLENGFKYYGSYDGTTMDSVNLMNGNLTLHIPLPFYYAQRGGKLDPRYFLVANSKNWNVQMSDPENTGEVLSWTYVGATGHFNTSWAYTGAYIATPITNLALLRTYITTSDESGVSAEASSPSLMTWDGASHPLALTAQGEVSQDTTGYQITLSNPDTYGVPQTATVTDRNGNVYQANFGDSGGCTRATNNNLNGATTTLTCQQSASADPIDSNGNVYGLTDTLGRTDLTATTTTNSTGCVSSLPFSSATIYSYTGPTGTAETLEVCYATITYQTNFTQAGVVQVQNAAQTAKTGNVVVSMILTDGTKYTLNWDSYGNVTSIGLPTGGSITYSWTQIGLPVCLNGSEAQVSRAVASRTVFDGTNSRTWNYTWGTQQSNGSITNIVTDPLGNSTVHGFSPVASSACSLYETSTMVYQGSNTSGQLLETINTTYSGTPYGSIAINVVPTSIQTTVGSSVKLVTKTYDTGLGTGQPIFADVVTEQEYDWGAGAHGAMLRQTNTSYLWQTNSSYASAGLLDLPSSVVVENAAGTRVAETDYTYDEPTYLTASNITTNHVAPLEGVRGNLSTVSKWLSTGSPVVSHTNWYDTGEPYQKIDPKGNKTTYAYSGTYAGAYPTTITNALNQVTTNVYDASTGLLTSTTDPNGQVSSFAYDTMFRKAQDTYPDGGQTSYCYTDIGGATCSASAAPFDLVITKKITSSESLKETAVTDGLGRVVQTQLNSDPSGVVYVDTTYDADGRKYTVSNPYRTKTDPTYGITSTVYDALGRTCVVIPPDGTSVANTSCPATQPSNDVFTTYSGNTTTVTDQQGKSRKSQTDGLGRLTNVWEDPTGLDYLTVYTYDPLGDLLTVVQGGSHNRTFVYDSLKRLTSSTNPETGTVTYTYDPDSNVATKLDARALTITYAYDALNRMTGKTYSNGDHAVTYTYDQSGCLGVTCYNVGRRTGMTDAAGSESWAYDKMGRELAEQRTSNTITKSTAYTYNLDGSLATLTYPSGRIITYAYSAAARPLSAIDTANSINYATSALYSPAGSLSSVANGANLISTLYYNTRLQPCRISVKSSGSTPTSCTDSANIGNILDYTYNFSLGSSDNGNVTGITNNVDTTRSQSFTYDHLNRILTAETTSTYATSPTHCWGESYTYDQWGNLTAIGVASTSYNSCTQESLSVTVSTLGNNQLSATGFSYDASGNMLTDSRHTYTWNAENQLKSVDGTTYTYTYDGDGHRVEKSNGKLYWYGTGSDPLMETDLSGNLTDEYIFFGGKRIARRDSSGNIVYYAADHLGTSRVVASSAGAILDQSDFYPFGGERVLSASSGNTYKFTSKERDTESNLDNFGARYDSSILGRFMSPDPKPASAHAVNPQSWNRYVYTLNNPMKYVDPNGLDIVLAAGLSQSDRSYVVNNLARMYATPAGKAMLQKADQSKFTITVGTGHLGRTDLTKAPAGAVVFGGQTKVEGGNTHYDVATSDGHTVLVAKSPDSPTASPIQVIIDKDQTSEIGKDPAKVFGHEFGGHTADVINAAEGNANQYIDGVNPKDESSSEAAEKAMGKVPNQPSPDDVKAVEELLKPKAAPQK
ncbi:MAG TPA: RHS repeat-associated core domain-containing protein [Candidatus Acidoferrales bacterium]|nr:RHS repeat-associated core domain-containing protein [Candidatus Acidoferrales bacterium]